MSHSVTIQTRTVTTGSPSPVNTGFCRSWTGILKIAQVILGAISVALISVAMHRYYGGRMYQTYLEAEQLFFMLIVTTFMIASTILVLSCLCSYTTESIISKTIFELLYHGIAFALLLAASITLVTKITKYSRPKEDLEMGACICGFINTALYFISTLFALRTSRGL